MATITSYLYDNQITVQLLDEDHLFKTRERIVYSRTLKIYKNIDNVITVQFRNSDQKPANIAQRTFTLTVYDNETTLLTLPVDVNVAAATGSVTIDQANAANIKISHCNYSIKYTIDGNLALPTYTDDNWGFYGQMQVISNVI